MILINGVVFYVSNRYSKHAEQNCISNCKKKDIIKECTMILVRITNGESVYPCNSCEHIITKYKLKKLYTYAISKN